MNKPLNQWTTADVTDFLKSVDKKTWIKVAVAAVFLIFSLIFIVEPAWLKRGAVRNEVKSIENQITTTNNLYRKKPELIKNREQYLKDVEILKKKIYKSEEATLLQGLISKVADDTEVSVITSRPNHTEVKFPVPFDSLYESNAFDFTLEGGYHALGAFVSSIESSQKMLRIQSFFLRPQEGNGQKHLADVDLFALSLKKKDAA